MTNGSRDFLVDTNILVYANDYRDAAKQRQAIDLLDNLARAGLGAVSTQVLGEFFVVSGRKLGDVMTADDRRAIVTGFVRFWEVLDITANAVADAVEGSLRHQLSYWDALIWATAKVNGIPFVLSEDFSDGRLVENVRFLNPLVPSFDLARLVRAN
jgi:predicted nucleic acid-binding protein